MNLNYINFDDFLRITTILPTSARPLNIYNKTLFNGFLSFSLIGSSLVLICINSTGDGDGGGPVHDGEEDGISMRGADIFLPEVVNILYKFNRYLYINILRVM